MAGNVRNIIVGAAAVYITAIDSTSGSWVQGDGTLGPLLPTDPAATGSSTLVTALDGSANWRNTGFTSEGIELQYEPDYGEVAVDQLLDSAKLFKQGMKVMVNTSLAEATLENLIVAWGQQDSSLKSGAGAGWDGVTLTAGESHLGIEAGGLGDEPVERGMVFVGPSPRKVVSNVNKKLERIYHTRRALSVQASNFSVKRNEATVFPVSFRLLADPIKSGAEYGSIRDRIV